MHMTCCASPDRISYMEIRASGNCGYIPRVTRLPFWRCTTLDSADYYTDEADFVSLAVNQNGLAVISYSEDDSYYLTTSLKLAYQKASVFLPLIQGQPGGD